MLWGQGAVRCFMGGGGGERAMVGVARGSWCCHRRWTFGGLGNSVACVGGPDCSAFPTVTVELGVLQSQLVWKGLALVNVGAENVRKVACLWVHHFGFAPVDVQLGGVSEC